MCGTYLPTDYDEWKLSYPPEWDDEYDPFDDFHDEDTEPDYGDW